MKTNEASYTAVARMAAVVGDAEMALTMAERLTAEGLTVHVRCFAPAMLAFSLNGRVSLDDLCQIIRRPVMYTSRPSPFPRYLFGQYAVLRQCPPASITACNSWYHSSVHCMPSHALALLRRINLCSLQVQYVIT